MINLVLAIRSLDIGGAERQFIELVRHIDKSLFSVTVCTLYGGAQESIVQNIPNVRYINLQKSGRYDFFSLCKKYSSCLQEISPSIIYSFLGEMNLFSLWCKPKETKIIWGFRASNIDFRQYGRVPQLLFWLQKKLSPKVSAIIANSTASVKFHQSQGFDMGRAVVIPNGIDTEKFYKNHLKRNNFRKKYGIEENAIIIGMVARIDPMKGYPVFCESAKRLLRKYNNVYFCAVGDGDASIKDRCEQILEGHSRFLWLGKQSHVEDFYSAFDISSSSSFGEGFSNSIAEAMSCECPCVVTDVGDSAVIVGDTGIVVTPQSAESLVSGLEKMLQLDFKSLGQRGRERIINNFSICTMVHETQRVIFQCVE